MKSDRKIVCSGGVCTIVKTNTTSTSKRKTSSPKRKTASSIKKRTSTSKRKTSPQLKYTNLTPYYTEEQLKNMKKDELQRICKSNQIRGYSTKTIPQLRTIILKRQNQARHTSLYALMDMDHLKVEAKKLGVSVSGTKQDIVDRIHKKKGVTAID